SVGDTDFADGTFAFPWSPVGPLERRRRFRSRGTYPILSARDSNFGGGRDWTLASARTCFRIARGRGDVVRARCGCASQLSNQAVVARAFRFLQRDHPFYDPSARRRDCFRAGLPRLLVAALSGAPCPAGNAARRFARLTGWTGHCRVEIAVAGASAGGQRQ